MTFVGTRPEVPKFIKEYTDEMYATLLLPAGVTSMASICYKDEERLLQGVCGGRPGLCGEDTAGEDEVEFYRAKENVYPKRRTGAF